MLANDKHHKHTVPPENMSYRWGIMGIIGGAGSDQDRRLCGRVRENCDNVSLIP